MTLVYPVLENWCWPIMILTRGCGNTCLHIHDDVVLNIGDGPPYYENTFVATHAFHIHDDLVSPVVEHWRWPTLILKGPLRHGDVVVLVLQTGDGPPLLYKCDCGHLCMSCTRRCCLSFVSLLRTDMGCSVCLRLLLKHVWRPHPPPHMFGAYLQVRLQMTRL